MLCSRTMFCNIFGAVGRLGMPTTWTDTTESSLGQRGGVNLIIRDFGIGNRQWDRNCS